MKHHFNHILKFGCIDPLIALESLLPWNAASFNLDLADAVYQVREVDDKPQFLIRTADGCTHTAGIAIVADRLHLTLPLPTAELSGLSHLVAALGLKSKIADGQFVLDPIDLEELDERLSAINMARTVLRRMAQCNPDTAAVIGSAIKIMTFATEWKVVRDEHFNCGKPKAQLLKRYEAAIEAAKQFQEWGITDLEGVTLHHDPRASAMDVQFKGYGAFAIVPSTYNWPVAQTLQQVLQRSEPAKKYGRYEVRPTRIPEDVRGVLHGLAIQGNKVRITAKLAKKLYDKVNEVLTTIGGAWHTGSQAHVFDCDPTEMIDQLIETGEIFTKADFELFETQPKEVRALIDRAELKPGMKVLEPEAGRGALAMAAAEVVGRDAVTVFELMPANVEHLARLGFNVTAPTDFLAVQTDQRFDAIVMNPPFSQGRDCAHIRHAWNFLAPGGRLAAIASTSWQTNSTAPAKEFQQFLASNHAIVEQIEAGAFHAAGTDVATTLITMVKPAESLVLEKPVEKTAKAAPRQELQESLF